MNFYRTYSDKFHSTPAEIDDTQLEFLLDMLELDTRIETEFAKVRGKGKKVYIDDIL